MSTQSLNDKVEEVRAKDVIAPESLSNKEIHNRKLRRYMSLFVMMLQYSILILTMRQSRMRPPSEQYYASTAVFLNEIIKIVFCLIISFYDIGIKETKNKVFCHDNWKLAIPAILYVIQNNLQYYAATNLDATVFQVTYQLKILTTAFFSVIMLHRNLSRNQWLMLLLLTIGVTMVQLPDTFWASLWSDNEGATPTEPDAAADRTRLLGLAAVFVSCLLSGLAGVYFELVLKKTQSVSLWVRNVQLAFYSIFPALFLGVFVKDGKKIAENGFFYGYTALTWIVIFQQAFGGVLVAIVVKYADNILKNFATSLSIILSAIISFAVWRTNVSFGFAVGASLVIISTYLFGVFEKRN
ncbi:hypothetical protein DASB73_023650 [Starmerella bacillaris]|uniref:UDP-galactose transporter n=1 Tax=Starmerella bacillaris TaxID=1247836 RepID=A0AAV5RJM7_STABA|nr:hypothetical protein DASB73_023650 [Starmerella bacillaris]